RVRLQLPGRRLDVPPIGREPGLRAHAGALPDDHRRGADRDPRRRRADGGPRPPHPGSEMSASSVGATDQLATPPVGPAPMVAQGGRGRWRDVWRAISRNKKALVGVLLLLVFVVLAIFPGQIAPYNGQAEIFLPALPPSHAHLLGTTSLGQDIFSQVIWGTRLSLVIALAVGGLATALAVLVGVSAGYLGGATDGFLSLVTDVILVLPIFPLIIVIAAYEKNAGLLTLVVVLGVLGWSYGARQLRSQTLSLRRRD